MLSVADEASRHDGAALGRGSHVKEPRGPLAKVSEELNPADNY